MNDDEMFRRFEREVMPQIKNSAITISICASDPDAKQCLELGAAILFDKPIVLFVPAGQTIPANLRRVASAIVEGDLLDENTKAKIQEAIERVMREDRRAQPTKEH